jgi:hypothetical protein
MLPKSQHPVALDVYRNGVHAANNVQVGAKISVRKTRNLVTNGNVVSAKVYRLRITHTRIQCVFEVTLECGIAKVLKTVFIKRIPTNWGVIIMGFITPTTPNKLYRRNRIIGDDMNERMDCSVIAIAIACSVSYQAAHAALKTAGRRNRCGTKIPVSKAAIKALGYTVRQWTKVEMRAMLKSYGLPPSKCYANITTHHPRQTSQGTGVSDAWQETHSNMIFVTAKHMLAYKDHEVSDWSINKALYVKHVWEVNPA